MPVNAVRIQPFQIPPGVPMSSIVFYAVPVSGYSAKTRIVLQAKGLRYEERLPPDGYRSPAYRAIVPMGTVPAIVVGDFCLSESEPIAEYLEERFPSPSLLPGDAQARARIRFLSRFHDLTLEPVVRSLFAHVDPSRRNEAIVKGALTQIEERLSRLECLLGQGPLAHGADLTLADCGFATTLPLAQRLTAATGQTLTYSRRLQQWLDALAAQPAVASALAPWWPATDTWIRANLNKDPA